MANNQYVNKVVYGNQTLIDLTGLNISASDVAQGYTTHNGAGQQITGTATDGSCEVYNKSAKKAILWLPTVVAHVEGKKLYINERSVS